MASSNSDEALTTAPQQDAGIAPSSVTEVISAMKDVVVSAVSTGSESKPVGSEGTTEESGPSKSAVKKDAKAAKKAERMAARQAQTQAAASKEEDDPLAANYGDMAMVQSTEISGKDWTLVGQLDSSLEGQKVLIRGRVHNSRGKGKMAFLVIREAGCTVQCVLSVGEHVSKGMVKYVSALSKESVVDVEGAVVVPGQAIESTSQQVELHVHKVYCVSRAAPVLPVSLEDAARSEQEIEKAEKEGVKYVRVGQDTRLNNRTVELRTPANQAIFRVQSAVGQLFREYLYSENFMEIHTPKLIAGASEGGASVFKLDYKGQPACLAQSPQLYKQMAICADFGRVFELGPVFRAEDSFTHRHLCEFTGLDIEMEIKEHYYEVLDIVNKLFVYIFNGLNARFSKELAAINAQYPFEPLKYTKEGVRISFSEGLALLRESGHPVEDEMADINTETEKRLGDLVRQKYGVDFYIMYRYPLGARAFYSMPCFDDPNYCNSFDVFVRGEEIISGAQRVHEPELLTKRAAECGIDLATIKAYVDSFRYGAVPHAGIGVGLERVVMLFCGLNNIRKTSLFPRDPQRLTP